MYYYKINPIEGGRNLRGAKRFEGESHLLGISARAANMGEESKRKWLIYDIYPPCTSFINQSTIIKRADSFFSLFNKCVHKGGRIVYEETRS